MRGLLVVVHRWAGLFIAVFLFVAGLTGSIISWAQELDEFFNPELFQAHRAGAAISPLNLASLFEAREPQARVAYVPLSIEPGKSLLLYVEPRLNTSTGKPFELDYNQAYIEPATGEIKGKRLWGKVSLARKNIIPFLYKLHYTLHLPDFFGIGGLGVWLMGIVGIVWTFDCFVGLCLTLPANRRNSRQDEGRNTNAPKTWLARWAPAWKIKTSASTYRLNFDIHRAAGLWAWLFLLMLAVTSISMNLGDKVVRPLLSQVFTLTPEVSDGRAQDTATSPMPFAPILKIAATEATRRNWQEPEGSIYLNQLAGVFRVAFFWPGAERVNGLEPKALYIDATSGAVLGQSVPWSGTFADVFMQLQFPLHSGRIAGLPGRILLSTMGLVVAALSFTGIVIWFKKRMARVRPRERREQNSASSSRLSPILRWLAETCHSATDENKLRSRLLQFAAAAATIGNDDRRMPLARVARLGGKASLLVLSAASVAAHTSFRDLNGRIQSVATPCRAYTALIFSRSFWASARRDADVYTRTARSFGAHCKERFSAGLRALMHS